jgi:hypothetical protein
MAQAVEHLLCKYKALSSAKIIIIIIIIIVIIKVKFKPTF